MNALYIQKDTEITLHLITFILLLFLACIDRIFRCILNWNLHSRCKNKDCFSTFISSRLYKVVDQLHFSFCLFFLICLFALLKILTCCFTCCYFILTPRYVEFFNLIKLVNKIKSLNIVFVISQWQTGTRGETSRSVNKHVKYLV